MVPKPSGPLVKTISISLISWILILISMPILIVYKKIIELILMAIHGERFGGFMDEADSLYLLPNESMDSLISIIIFIRSEKKKDVYRETRTAVQQKVLNKPNSYVKLTSSKKSFGGYPYLFKYDCGVEDLVSFIEVPEDKRFNENYVKEVAASLIKKKLPKNNSVLWDIHVTNRTLEEGENGENKYYRYPIIVRFHHSVGDGTALNLLFMQVIGDENSQKYSEDLAKKILIGLSQEQKRKDFSDVIRSHLRSTINRLKFWTDFIFLAPGRAIETIYMKPSDVNALHEKQCGEKIVAWTIEEKPEYISRIKRIKERIPNTTFSSVVTTALLASLSNYFIKNKLPVPEHVHMLMTMLLGFPKIDPDKPVSLKNRTSGTTLELPLQESSKNLTDFLRNVSMNMQEQIRYADVILNRFYVSYVTGKIPLTILPTALQPQTFTLTNIPGGSPIKILNGCPVESFVPFPPNFHGIGLTFTILTYGDRFQLSLLADKALLHSQSEAQKIVDDVFTHIDFLDTESQELFLEK